MSWKTNRRTQRHFRAGGPEYSEITASAVAEMASLGPKYNVEGADAFYNPINDTIYFDFVKMSGESEWRAEYDVVHEYLHALLLRKGVPPEQHHAIILKMIHPSDK